jgi:hypothetical protein
LTPAEAVYFPALQSAQVVKEAPTAAECSPTQSVQTVAALAPEYLPAAQLVQKYSGASAASWRNRRRRRRSEGKQEGT